VVVAVLGCFLAGSSQGASEKGVCAGTVQHFELSRVFAEESLGINGTIVWRGTIHWLEYDPNGWRFELRIEGFDVNTNDTDVRQRVEQVKPCTLVVALRKDEPVPLSTEITEGQATNDAGLAIQYGVAGEVTSLMLANVLSMDFVVSKRGKETIAEIEYPKQVKKPFGVQDANLAKFYAEPRRFYVFPYMIGKEPGSALVSFSFYQSGVIYEYRLLDRESGLATYAVKLRAAMKKGTDGTYESLIDIMDQPDKFFSYHLERLKVTGPHR